jgi:hypothetical protein
MQICSNLRHPQIDAKYLFPLDLAARRSKLPCVTPASFNHLSVAVAAIIVSGTFWIAIL